MEGEILYAYLAGMLDADGTIGIRWYKAGKINPRKYHRPIVEVGSMCQEVIQLYVDTFQCGHIWQHSKVNNGYFYCWRAVGTACNKVLPKLLPYLVIKCKQANVCLEIVGRMRQKGGRHLSSDEWEKEDAERHRLFLIMKELNSHERRV